jgi:hypothetical protein
MHYLTQDICQNKILTVELYCPGHFKELLTVMIVRSCAFHVADRFGVHVDDIVKERRVQRPLATSTKSATGDKADWLSVIEKHVGEIKNAK